MVTSGTGDLYAVIRPIVSGRRIRQPNWCCVRHLSFAYERGRLREPPMRHRDHDDECLTSTLRQLIPSPTISRPKRRYILSGDRKPQKQ
jgi:hypothetical protein